MTTLLDILKFILNRLIQNELWFTQTIVQTDMYMSKIEHELNETKTVVAEIKEDIEKLQTDLETMSKVPFIRLSSHFTITLTLCCVCCVDDE